jgi:hypothetical protein
MGMHYDSFVLRCWRLSDAQCKRRMAPPAEVNSTDKSAPIDDRHMS